MRAVCRHLALILLILTGVGFTLKSALAAELVPHRAFYTLEPVGTAHQEQPIIGVRGIVEVNHEKSCDGWTMVERLRMELMTREGALLSQELRFTGWETLDGSTYRFAAKGVSPTADLDILGSGKMRDGKGEINFDRPKGKKFPVPSDTRFPISLLAWIVDQAKSGEKRIKSHSFDGTDTAGAELMTVFINGKGEPVYDLGVVRNELLTSSGWKMRFAAFAEGQKTSEPAYAYDAVILENGVMAEALLEFSGFTVKQTLKQINELPEPVC